MQNQEDSPGIDRSTGLNTDSGVLPALTGYSQGDALN